MKAIIDYHKYEAIDVQKHDMYVSIPLGCKKLRKMIGVWSLLVNWGDNLESWIALKEFKELHPVETAEFSKD